MSLLAAFLALLIASVITLVELVTTKYPRTFFALFNCRSLYIYSLLYGAVAFVIVLVLPPTKFNLPDPFIEAIIVGLSIKALLNINFFSVPVPNSSETFPVGPQTLTRLVEPWLIDAIGTHEFNKIRAFVKSRAAKHSDPDTVRKQILENLPQSIMENEKEYAGFVRDIDRRLQAEPKVVRAMEYYLYRMGKDSFNQVFPP